MSLYALGSPEALLSGKLPLYPGARGDLAAIERHVHCSRSSGTMLVVYVKSPLVALSRAVLSARSDWSCAYECRAADEAAWNEQFPCKGGASQRYCPSRSGGSGSRISYCTYHLSSIISTAVSLLLSARSRMNKVGGTFFDACVGIIAGPIVVYLAFEVAQMGTSTVPNLC